MALTNQPIIDYNSFFTNTSTLTNFAHLDSELRSGVYIQQAHPDQQRLAWYLEDNLITIREYYLTVYGFKLQHRNDEDRRYYFITPTELSISKISQTFLRELTPDLIIVGMLLCQVVLVDLEEPSTVEELMELLIKQYTPYKEGLLKHVSRVRGSKNFATDRDEAKVKSWITKAINEFAQLGWIYKPGDGTFKVMPSLDYLRNLYRDDIDRMSEVFSSNF